MACSLEGQPEAGETRKIRLFEIQLSDLEEIQGRYAGIQARRPSERMGDRGTHIGVAELGEYGAVLVLDQGVDHALRVDDNLDAIGVGPEQPTGLDDLQTLVHHGGRVDRDLATHRPRGMCAGLIGGDRRESFDRPIAQWAAGRGQQNAFHPDRGQALAEVRRQTLEDGVVLAVDRKQLRAALLHGTHEQGPGHHQRLLVGEQQTLACTGCGQRGRQTRGTDDRRHDVSGLGHGRDLLETFDTREDLRAPRHVREQLAQTLRRSLLDHHRDLRSVTPALLGHALAVAICRQGDRAKLLGMTGDDIEGAYADRAGRAEDSYADHVATPIKVIPKANTGAAAVKLSIRSSMPPCPGKR